MKWLMTILLCAIPLPAEPAVSFSRQIAPVLKDKCLACHSIEKAKGGYRVHSFAAAVSPGKSGKPAIVPGEPETSELFRRLVTEDLDDRMPQEDQALPSSTIAMFRQWIAEGAKLDSGSPETPLAELLPLERLPAPEAYPRALPILALAFDPSGELLAASGYREVTLWRTNGELARRFAQAPTRVRDLAFHPSGTHLAVAGGVPGRAGELSIFDASSGTLETTLVRTGDELLALAFSSNGQLLAAGGSDHAIHLFAWADRRKLATIQQHADWVTALSFDAAGRQLASASRDRTARVYAVDSAELVTTYPAHNAPLFAAVFAENEMVASGGRDRSVHLWNVADGKRKHELGSFGGEILRMQIAAGRLYAASSDGTVRQYSLQDRKLLRTFAHGGGPVYALSIDPSSRRLASAGQNGETKLWDAGTGELAARFYAAPGYRASAE